MKSQSLSVLGWFLLAPLLPAAEFSTSNSSQFASAMLEESVSVGTNASEYISWMQQQSALGARADMGGDEDAGAAGKRGDSSTSTTPPVTSMRAKEVATGLVYANAAGKLKRTEIAPLWGEGGYIQFFEQSAPIRFSPNLNQSVVVETTKAAGRSPSQSATAGLAYVEENTGRRIIIALPRDSAVQATQDGVFYTNAFDQVDGDVVYKVHPWGLEQFVYLYGDLPDPGDLGLDAETSTLCVLTEIMGLDLAQMGVNRDAGKEPGELSPEPMQVFRESLGGWTEAHHFLRSYAYSGREGIAIGGTQMDATDRQPVSIRLLREGGRIFLSEEIPLAALRSRHPELFRTEPSSRDLSLRLPPPRAGSDETPAMGAPDAIQELAHHYVPRPESHFVMDYIEYTGSNTVDMIFRSGNTYFISAPLILSGSKLTLEPGAIVKFATNAYIQLINGAWVESRSHLLNPAIFTSASDTNRGELIYSGQDPMTSRYVRALILDGGTNDLSGIAIHYAQIGVEINAAGNQRVRDSQIFQSHRGISLSGTSTTGWLFNVLIRDGAEGIYAGSKSAQIAQHTFMGLTNWAVSTGGGIADLEMRQNIFYSIPNAFASNVPLNVATVGANASYDVFTGWMGAAVVSLSSNTFLVGPYGSNYLAQTSPAVDAGSTSASAVGLFHYTTSTNGIKETNSVVDIGFHYATTHDLDGDGLPDFVEDSNGDGSFNAGDYSNLDDSDTDDDGLDDAEEHALGTNPQAPDTDGDGISDYVEVTYGTDPLNAASFPATISGQTIYSGSQTGTLHISLTPYAVNTNQPALSLSFDAAHPTYDNSAWQNPLTVNGATWTNSGKYGGAYSFDGNDTITLGKLYQAVGIYNVSWGAWIAAEPGIWLGGILGKTYFGNDALYMILADSGSSVETRIKPADGGAARDAIKPAMITNGVWQHLFVTYDGTQTKLYLNGGLVATSAVFAAQPVRSNNVDAALGDLSPGAGWYFRGRMDEVQLYRATLTDAEIAGMYRSSLTAEYTRAATQFTTGSYSFAQVPTLSNYWVMAWRDGNGNGIRDYYEPVGFYNGNSFLLTNALTGVDIELHDPDSDGDGASDWLELQVGTDPASSASVPVTISGTLAYSGGQTGPIVVSAEIESGLLLHYDFDTPNTSRVSNVISTLYTGIVNGALYVTNGHTGGAYWYDGINDYILVGPMGVLPEGTISYWINPDVVENWRNPFTTDYAGWDDCIRFEAYSSGVFLGAGYGLTGQCWYAASMPTATWQHIVLTWNQSNAWGYYNGTFKFHSFHQGQGGTVGLNPSMDNVAIGNGYSTAANRYWKGRIDEVKIYGRTLSSNDVASLYTTGSGTGLLRYTTTIAGPGPYVISNIPNRMGYRLTAWRDSNTNGLQDEAEAWATYSNNPIVLMQNVTNANLELVDPDTDLDGMPDWWEILHGFNPNSLAQSQMIAWWPFEESGGLVASNVVSTNYSGTLENMTSSNRVPGMFGQAMWFDGANDFISIGPDLSAAITNTITVDAWVWAESLDEESAWRGIFNEVFPDAGQVEFSLTLHGTSHLASVGYFDGTWRMRQDSAGFQTGRWTRVTGSFDRTNLALYVDGVLRASGLSGSSTLPNGSDGWRIGRRHDFGNPGNMWHGMLDEIRVYSVALSSNAVATMYDALGDADGDGLSNLQEYELGTDPNAQDSDGDGLPDAWEIQHGLDPNDFGDGRADNDGDGWNNSEEYAVNSDPNDNESIPHITYYVDDITGSDASAGSLFAPFKTIQRALTEAASGEWVLIKPGTYKGTNNMNLSFSGKAIKLRSFMNDAESVVLDAERAGRLFSFTSGETTNALVSAITVTGGYTNHGAGIYCKTSSPTLRGLKIIGNHAIQNGGGLYAEGSRLIVSDSFFVGNQADIDGGGAWICAWYQAFVSLGSHVRIEDTVFSENRARNGGAIGLLDSSPSGASSGYYPGTSIVERCRVVQSQSTGGSIYVGMMKTVHILDSIIANNEGYGVKNHYGNLLFLHSTATRNRLTSFWGAGILSEHGSSDPYIGRTQIRNSIIWGNSPADDQIYAFRPAAPPGPCTVEYTTYSPARHEPANAGYSNRTIYGAGTLTNDPMLTAFGHLRLESPARNAGSMAWVTARDIDGEARPQGLGVDMGADEYLDSNADGFPDWWLIQYGIDILEYLDPDDNFNGNELSNAQEYIAESDPFAPFSDSDNDGLSDAAEVYYGTDPNNWDTSGNLFPDGWLVEYGYDPLDPSGIDPDGDDDEDGLSNFEEMRNGTHPRESDTDGDEVSDGVEVAQGSDPADPDDLGDPENCVVLELVIGDHSGSHSERYLMVVGKKVHQSAGFGVVSTVEYAFVKGKTYPIKVQWVATNMETPDYDYTAQIGGLGGGVGWHAGEESLIHDPQGVLGVHDEGSYNFAAGKEAWLYILSVEFDNVWDRNLEHEDDDDYPEYRKCIAIEHDSPSEVNLTNYLSIAPSSLTFDDIKEHVSFNIEHQIFSTATIKDDSVLDYNWLDPDDVNIYAFGVQLLCGGSVVDRLIVVVYSDETEPEHTDWIAQNTTEGTAWLNELPRVYSTLGAGNTDPEPVQCDPQQWGWDPGLPDFYHFNAVFEIRSRRSDGGHGHQACYDGTGALITGSGSLTSLASAGTADFGYWENIFPPLHLTHDVRPFIRAAQLDGNPVEGLPSATIPANLSHPLIRIGPHLQAYYSWRPPQTGNTRATGQCIDPGECSFH